MAVDIFEWSGSIMGLLGAFLLATHSRLSRYGWIAFLIANFAMIAFALSIEKNGLLLQQVGFTVTSILGLFRAGFFTRKTSFLKKTNLTANEKKEDCKTAPAFDFFSGYVATHDANIRVDFKVPTNASISEKDSAFVKALSEVTTLNYLCIGSTSEK